MTGHLRRVKRWGAALALFLTASACGFEVVETRWGFHGKVVPGRFALLSVLLRNPSDLPYDGEVAAFRDDGLDQRRGAFFVQSVYVSPGECRWVQFYPYIGEQDNHRSWQLGWGRRFRRRAPLAAPVLGPPGTVALEGATGGLLGIGGVSRSLPEQLFPPCASACGGLHAVLLDHVPDWDPARRRAFRDWANGGGVVHLFPDVSGELPRFSGDLAVLNEWRAHGGRGRVVRHRKCLREVDWQTWESSMGAGPQLHANPAGYMESADLLLFAVLGAVVNVKRDWRAILWFAGAYSLLASLGHFLVFQKTRRPLVPILTAVALAVLFSWGFRMVSLNGQGQGSSLVVCSYARSLGEGRCDVTQWAHAFTGRGRQYAFRSAGHGGVFSTCHDWEAVDAVAAQGAERRFLVDMPVASTRSFVHRAVIESAQLTARITDVAVGEIEKTVQTTEKLAKSHGRKVRRRKVAAQGLQRLALEIQPPELAAAVRAVEVAYGGDLYTLREIAPSGRCSGVGPAVHLDQFYNVSDMRTLQYWDRRNSRNALAPDRAFAACMKSVATRALGGGSAFPHRLESQPLAGETRTLDVFIRVDDPSPFMLGVDGFPKRLGTTIYHFTLPACVAPGEEQGQSE